MEAIKLAPTLVPAAVLSAKYESEAHQVRRAMRIVETAWQAHPHPDLADAYAHVKLGDSARQRLVRTETLAAKAPGHLESALAVARAAIDASEFARAREALVPFVAAPTQRVAMLMAEIERTEHGDSGRARAWTLRAVHARHDPVWTADGYVSEQWRPVSPVSGRLDAFQWQTPVAALPSDKSAAIEAKEFEREFHEAISAPRRVEPPREAPAEAAAEKTGVTRQESAPAAQDNVQDSGQANLQDNLQDNTPANSPASAANSEPAPSPAPALTAPEASSPAAAPLFRPRSDLGKPGTAAIPPVIPIIRAPDDPGIDEDGRDEFAEPLNSPKGQAGGWRGFLARWGG
jgi:HemY protein